MSRSAGTSAMTVRSTWARKPASRAVSPLRRPNNSTTPIRSWLSTVVLKRVDRLDRAADRGREADAIIGAEDVIVHRLGDRDDRHALRREMRREAQGAVAAQGDHGVDAELLEDVEHPLGLVALRQRARIGARGVEDGAAHPVDPANAFAGQRQAVGGDAGRIGRVDRQHPLPAAAEAGHLPAEIVGGQGDRADAGVEPRHVAAAGQEADAHVRSGRGGEGDAQLAALAGAARPSRRC